MDALRRGADVTGKSLVRRALSGHAAIGLLSGALMYLIVLSGALAVVAPRLERWEQSSAPEMTVMAPAAVQNAVAEAAAQKPPSILVTLPTAELPRTSVTGAEAPYYVDSDGKRAATVAHPWTDFILALHINLNLPQVIGLIIVGALGSMLTALAITGVIAHPRIFRDAFRLRARANRQLAQADWHNRLGVWTLPFTVAVALTGAFLGLAVADGTLLVKQYHQGDISKVYAPIFGDQSAPGGDPAPVADVATALTTMREQFPDVSPTFVTVAAPGTAGQRVQIVADVPRRLIYGESYQFDSSGRFLGEVGLSNGRLGQQAAASTYKLHFGNFGGVWVELAYVALGLCLTVVSGTGMSLWLQKRQRRGQASPRLEAFWTVIVWGVPMLMILPLWTTRWGLNVSAALTFWAALAAAVVVATGWPQWIHGRMLRVFLALMMGVTGAAGLLIDSSRASAVAIDISLLIGALVLVAAERHGPRAAFTSG